MALEQIEIDVHVESNVEKLSETAVRRFLADALTGTVEDAEEFLSFIVPKLSGELAGHVEHTEAAQENLAAAVGIPPIHKDTGVTPAVKDMFAPGEQDSDDYPLFRDRGTGIFGPAHEPIHARKVSVMKFDGPMGHPIFRAETKGMEGAHFMLATYAFARVAFQAHIQEFEERVKNLPATGSQL